MWLLHGPITMEKIMATMLKQSTYFFQAAETEICHLVKVLYDAISKTLIHYYKDHEKLNDLLLRPTETPAVNIGGIIIYFGLTFKSGT